MALVNGRHYPQGFRTGVNAGSLPQVTSEERLGELRGFAMNRVAVDTRGIGAKTPRAVGQRLGLEWPAQVG